MNEETKKDLKLEELTQIEEAKGLNFLSSGLVVEFYDVEWKASGYYLLTDDPWISEKNYQGSRLVGTSIEEATHYHLGQEAHDTKKWKTKMKLITPITFFKEEQNGVY